MKHPLNNIRDAAQHIRLTEAEKSAMRDQLFELMRQTQVSTRPAASPYFFWTNVTVQRFAMPFAVLLIIVAGGTTTYAAQGALPGGVLYPVKIYVNENVQGVLAVSDTAKVSFHTSAAQERLKEAEALAAQGKLSAQASAELEANFNDHVAQADTLAATLEAHDPADAVDARTTLDSSLAAHSAILAKLGDSSKDEQTKENSTAISARVLARGQGGVVAVALKAAAPAATMALMATNQEDASSSDTARAQTQPMMAAKMAPGSATATPATPDQSQKKLAIQLQKKANKQLDTAHETYTDDRAALSASTTAQVKAQLNALDDQYDAGKKALKNNDYIGAQQIFTVVIKQSVELSALIEASKSYKQDFIRGDNLPDQSNEGEHDEDRGSDERQGGIRLNLHL